MARIIYGVCGEGMGHAIRGKPILGHLTKRHRVKIFADEKAYAYLKRYFEDINKIQGLHIKYKNNSVDGIKTFIFNLSNIAKLIRSYIALSREAKSFRPDLIISDLDMVSSYVALFSKIPIISVDNQHAAGKIRIDFPKKHLISFIKTRFVNRLMTIHADYYLITSFFYPEIKSKKASLVPPILREEIFRMKAKERGYFLVYQTSDTNKRLIEILKKTGKKFIVY